MKLLDILFPKSYCRTNDSITEGKSIDNLVTNVPKQLAKSQSARTTLEDVYKPDFYTDFFLDHINLSYMDTYPEQLEIVYRHLINDNLSTTFKHVFGHDLSWARLDYNKDHYKFKTILSTNKNILSRFIYTISPSVSIDLTLRLNHIDQTLSKICSDSSVYTQINYLKDKYSLQLLSTSSSTFIMTGLYQLTKNITIGGEITNSQGTKLIDKLLPSFGSIGLSYHTDKYRISCGVCPENALLLQYTHKVSKDNTFLVHLFKVKDASVLSVAYDYFFPLSSARVRCNVSSDLKISTSISEQISENIRLTFTGNADFQKGMYGFGVGINVNDAEGLEMKYTPKIGSLFR